MKGFTQSVWLGSLNIICVDDDTDFIKELSKTLSTYIHTTIILAS